MFSQNRIDILRLIIHSNFGKSPTPICPPNHRLVLSGCGKGPGRSSVFFQRLVYISRSAIVPNRLICRKTTLPVTEALSGIFYEQFNNKTLWAMAKKQTNLQYIWSCLTKVFKYDKTTLLNYLQPLGSSAPKVKTQYLHYAPMTKGSMGQCYTLYNIVPYFLLSWAGSVDTAFLLGGGDVLRHCNNCAYRIVGRGQGRGDSHHTFRIKTKVYQIMLTMCYLRQEECATELNWPESWLYLS